jgi:hypothetical protein
MMAVVLSADNLWPEAVEVAQLYAPDDVAHNAPRRISHLHTFLMRQIAAVFAAGDVSEAETESSLTLDNAARRSDVTDP